MKQKGLWIVWSFLVAVLLIAVPSALNYSPQLFGKDFTDSQDFKWRMDEIYDTLGAAVLNPINPDEAVKHVTVSSEEIEEHRNRYGTLPEQLANIHAQYEDRITQAKEAGNETVLTALVKERNAKMEDIQKNFESDAHVEEKIRKEKAKYLKSYLEDRINDYSFSFPIVYQLKDVETGEEFSSGDIHVPVGYEKTFDSSLGYLKARSLPFTVNELTFSRPGNSAVEVSDYDLVNMQNPVRQFEGTVIVPKSVFAEGGMLNYEYTRYNTSKYAAYMFWAIAIISAILLFTVMKFKKAWVMETRLVDVYERLKIDGKAAVFFLAAIILLFYTRNMAHNVINVFSSMSLERWVMEVISFMLFGVLTVAILVFQVFNGIERWKQQGVFEKDLMDSYTVRFFAALQGMFTKASIGVQTFILLIGFFLAGIGFVGMFLDPYFMLIYFMCVLFLGFPVLFFFVRRVAYLNKIFVATEAMAAGRLQQDIAIQGKSPLAEHARNLNNLREGVRNSMSEQAKSERLKTELITNVSHDLRTPLTSIITYTDLLKKEGLTPEERAQYVDILDKKSQRLKTLIEDLFEVSKMASGNLELHKQRVDLTQLLQQALAEHAEDIAKSGLDFRTDMPEEPLISYVDGQRWWRVLDNLIVNAIKYSLPGTRVYITLRKMGDTAEFVVKNITKYELGANVEELFERFKRADTARHTDGSGLGLAIAQSIVDMHQGTMKIELDGDLFKVTVVVPAGY
ncbi:histidine kinase dimerization/phospho-acceptor domain-containing protein [Sporosarcina cyprini]|uniref:histidine kinase dimerization/phospho-acceptor domain-containing protein n=1 Tax=Sporosarcina cyprini TaxID=2910523 RepID=UPI001EDDCE17|nr:histidine kinase dimerization/phospho-acceptor domain-containing protein [Sporosarcina cyprini]MCG3086463.1 HAMP domain-containing histidine kinase [Sporosarcina cyprini]